MRYHQQQTAVGVCRECGTPHVATQCPKQKSRNLVQAIDRLNTLRKMYDNMAKTAEDPEWRRVREHQRDTMLEAINVVVDYTGGN